MRNQLRRKSGVVPRIAALGILGLGVASALAQKAEPSAEQDRINRLEATVAQELPTSQEAANALLELNGIYQKGGQTFGIVRTARAFVSAHASHPRHSELMVSLIDGLCASSLSSDIKATCRQFLERYPKSGDVSYVAQRLAEVLDREGDRWGAAEAYSRAWQTGGGRRDHAHGYRAIELFRAINQPDAHRANMEFATKMYPALGKTQAAASVALAAFQGAHGCGEWKRSNDIAADIQKRGLPVSPDSRYELARHVAINHNNLGDPAAGSRSMEQAFRAKPTAQSLHFLIRAMANAKADPGQVGKLADQFERDYPGDKHLRYVLNDLSHAYRHRDDFGNAIAAATRALRFTDSSFNTASNVISWTHDGKGNVNGLDGLLRKAADEADRAGKDGWRILWSLAYTHYRDRAKDEAKTRQTMEHLLFGTNYPPNDGRAKDVFRDLTGYVDEATQRSLVDRYFDHARRFPQRGHYLRGLRNWANESGRDNHRKKAAQHASQKLKQLGGDAVMKQWSLFGEEKNGIEARKQLLGRGDITKEQRIALLDRQAWVFRHRMGDRERPQSANLYHEVVKLQPDNFKAAREFLEAARHYGSDDQRRQAVDHLLKRPAESYDIHAIRNLMALAVYLADTELGKRAFAWITAAEKTHGVAMDYSGEIGDGLIKLELRNEAKAWLETHTKVDSNHWDHAGNVARLIDHGLIPEEQAEAFLSGFAKTDSDSHGAFAARQADIAFKSGNIKRAAELVEAAAKRQAGRPFRRSGFSEHPAQHWIEAMAKDDFEGDPKLRVRLLTAIQSMRAGRPSASAQLEMLRLSPTTPAGVDRLLAARDATFMASRDHHSWNRFYGYAQAYQARGDHGTAATLATAMIQNTATDDNQRNAARGLVSRAYGEMGSLGLEVDPDSPIAPLLGIGLHLRLGDLQRATETYVNNQKLFDQHRKELPTEIVLFAAETHLTAGGKDELRRAEDMLRQWTIQFGEKEDIPVRDKARVGLLLAKAYQRAGRFEVARSEFTSIVNRFPEDSGAIDAQFGIGETFMEQKIFDQAEPIFEELSLSTDSAIRIRANFLKGILASRMGDNDEAREFFRQVLASSPDTELADKALFSLAEVYGGQQRYLDQLELLRTVGRLGRESARWLIPGRALSVVVQDPDLGISRGDGRIPVEVKAEPGGDVETAMLRAGGAGRGIFIGEIPTAVGAAIPNDGILQVLGADEITVGYPQEFRDQFKSSGSGAAGGIIKLASDAKFAMASSEVPDPAEELKAEEENLMMETELAELLRAEVRPNNQIKPGNQLYLRVDDPDRSATAEIDDVVVKVEASSGDAVEVRLTETGGDTGAFTGVLATADLPAAASASDTSIDHAALMAIDRADNTAWVSEPDGVAPKWLTVDLKDLVTVDNVIVSTPSPEGQRPRKINLMASHDGRFFYRVARFPVPDAAKAVPAGGFEKPFGKLYRADLNQFRSWDLLVDIAKRAKLVEQVDVASAGGLTWTNPQIEDNKRVRGKHQRAHIMHWQFPFVQERQGAIRFGFAGGSDLAVLMVDGEIVYSTLSSPGSRRQKSVDVMLGSGVHEIVAYVGANETNRKNFEFTLLRGRENVNREQVAVAGFTQTDFDRTNRQPAEIVSASIAAEAEGKWQFEFQPTQARYLRFDIPEFDGESVAINSVKVRGGDQQIIPTEADLMALALNDVLEIAPGDSVTATFIDAVTAGGLARNRPLVEKVTATYNNGGIRAVAYDFLRGSNGSVAELKRNLYRIDPGERVSIEVTDYDLDQTTEADQVDIEVMVGAGDPIVLTAVETEPSSGIFRGEFDSVPVDAPEEPAPEAGEATAEQNLATAKVPVKAGDTIVMRYRDVDNTFPGHSSYREARVLVRKPTPGKLRIIPTRWTAAPEVSDDDRAAGRKSQPRVEFLTEAQGSSDAIAYHVPLTIEVIDPDAARHDASSVRVALDPGNGAPPVFVDCYVAASYAAPGLLDENEAFPALVAGRFVGQVKMQLGDANSPVAVPVNLDDRLNLLGTVEIEGDPADATDAPEGGTFVTSDTGTMYVLNVSGGTQISATYEEELAPDPASAVHTDRARLSTTAQIALTGPDGSQLGAPRGSTNPNVKEESVQIEPEQIHIGERLTVQLEDPDRDTSAERDTVTVTLVTGLGEKEELVLQETLAHSGVFTGSVEMVAAKQATPGNIDLAAPSLDAFFNDVLSARYAEVDPDGKTVELDASTGIAPGTDGMAAAFSKLFSDEDLAVETGFHIAECYFELFKGHRELDRMEDAEADLRLGRLVLRELREDYPDPKYAPRTAYLLGQFSQELEDWEEAAAAYQSIVRDHPDHSLAPDAQYKLGQCWEEAEKFDDALEAYVTLAATYPDSPLIASVMLRISEHFYQNEDFENSASVGERFLAKFETHQWSPKMAFRIGQCHYKGENYKDAGAAFDDFIKRFPDEDLAAQSLFWSGESYRMANNVSDAFQRYNRCRWDFPESDAAKYARGRLALPEMLQQFEREAQAVENEQ